MDFDDILPLIGGFGRHQWKVFLLTIFPTVVNLFNTVGNIVLFAQPKYRCMFPNETENSSTFLNNLDDAITGCTFLLNNSITECEKFVFDHDQFGNTAVIEFELVCSREYLIATINALSMLGFMVGSFVFGIASDRWGRKSIFLFCSVGYLIFGVIIIFSSTIWIYLLIKLLHASMIAGLFYPFYTLLLESVEPSKRVLVGSSLIIFFPVGFVTVAIYGYISPSWKYAQLAFTLTGLPLVLYAWLIPESARWLISKNKISEAKKVIHRIAKENKTIILNENLESLLTRKSNNKKPKDVSVIDAMRYPVLRVRIFALVTISMIGYMVFLGVSLGTSKLYGNLYINVALMGIVDLPGILIVLKIGQRFGRRVVVSSVLALSGICLLVAVLWITEEKWVFACTLLAKLFAAVSLNLFYVYSTEIYPTVLRNSGLGLDGVFGGIGSMISPFVVHSGTFWRPLPNVVFGVLLLFASCICQLLPETFKKKLPETLEEGESFEK